MTDLEMLLARCDFFSLNREQALVVLADVCTAVSDWRRVALSPEVGLTELELDDFAPAFEHDQCEAARGLLK